MFDVFSFLSEFSIQHINTGKNVSSGWIGINCPFCSDSGFHGGFNVRTGGFNCWKCGHHSLIEVISQLTFSNNPYEIIKKHQSGVSEKKIFFEPIKALRGAKSPKNFSSKLSLPPESENLLSRHKSYLEKRNFDPEKLERFWKLKGTRNLGAYKFRIIAPIFYKEQLVSYQGRDITEKSPLRYKACKKINELVPHKHVLYGFDHIIRNTVIVVEGITDVWRLGYGAVATFGTSFTLKQVKLLKEFKRVQVLFDSGKEAQIKAKKLVSLLSPFTEVNLFEMEKGDPGSLSEKESMYVKKQLLKR